jgi:hypothetical protein
VKRKSKNQSKKAFADVELARVVARSARFANSSGAFAGWSLPAAALRINVARRLASAEQRTGIGAQADR